MAAVLLSSWLTSRSLQDLLDSEHLVSHTDMVVAECESLLAAVAQAESNSRSYLLTGNRMYAAERDSGAQSVRSLLLRLESDTSFEPSQRPLVKALEPLIEERLKILASVGEIYEKAGLPAAQDEVRLGRGTSVGNEIINKVHEIEQHERQIQVERMQQAEQRASRTREFILFAGIPAALLIALLAVLWYHELGVRSRVEGDLRSANTTLDTVMQKAPVAIFSLDSEERVRFWNPTAEAIFGLRAQELLGHPLPTGSDERATQLASLRQRVYFGEAGVITTPWVRKDGRRIFVEFSLSPIYGDKSCLTGLVGIASDVTAKREAEHRLRESLVTQHALLQCAGDGIYGMDLHGKVSFLNSAALGMFGYTESELLGEHIHTKVHHTRLDGTPHPARACPIYRTISTGESARVTNDVFWKKDGTSFPVEYVSTPLRVDNEIVGAVVSFRDISERLAVERMKDQFVSLVSHELRTPLTSIRGSLGLLAGGALGEVPDAARGMLNIAVTNTDRLIRLINDILDLERMDSGLVTMKKEWCDLGEIAKHSIEGVRGAAEQANVSIDYSGEKSVRAFCDPDKMVQVFTNLLGNAVKFSKESSKVSVRIEAEDQFAVISVADNGRGIPQQKLSSIFERFQQVDASDSREKGGSGLGLAIVKTIVELHGGKVWAESVYGEGSTFRVRLPLKAEEQRSEGPAILLFMPEAESMTGLLQTQGFAVIPVSDGASVLKTAKERRPDIILLDLGGGFESVWETLARLREDETTARIPTMVVPLSPPAGQQAGDLRVAERELVANIKRVLKPASEAQVLLVEDDVDLANVLQTIFDKDGITVAHAASGREAMEYCGEFTPQLILLDLILPEFDGFAVVSHLRQHERLRNVPLVVYTAKDISESEKRKLILGPTQFLTKSHATPEEVERLVASMVQTKA